MSRYELLLFLHIAASIVWIGAGFLFQVLGLRAVRVGDPARMSAVLDELNALSTRLFIPASVAVFLLGVALTIDGPWSFGDAWIVIGLAGYAATFLTGLLFIKPQGEKIAALIGREGGVTPAVFDEVRRLMLISRVDLVVLFVVVADMTFKPTTDDVGVLAAMVVAVLLAAAYVVWRFRESAAPAREPA